MDTTKIEILDEIILKWSSLINDNMSSFLKTNKVILNDSFITKIKEKKLTAFSDFASQIILDFKNIKQKDKLENKKTSYKFNALRFFSIGETMHSFLLANLLNPKSEHGQNNLFLDLLLDKLQIEKNAKSEWTVTAEKQRIDILLKRKNPHSVVIIENKSNYAKDQENQLYRYWYYQIHLNNPNIDYNDKNTVSKNYQIIYLTPADWKIPTDNSLKRPKFLDFDKSLPDKIPIEPKIICFNPDIVNLLEDGINKLNSDEK